MKDNICAYAEYPYNLVIAAKGNSNVGFPETSKENILLGLEHVLSKLDKQESLFLRQRFTEGKTLEELSVEFSITRDKAEQWEQNILKKLRIPSRWGFIQFGIEGYIKIRLEEVRTTAYKRGYVEGYDKGVQDKQNNRVSENILDMPLEILELPVNTFNALIQANFERIGDLVDLSETQIIRIRHLGNKSIRAVSEALHKCGITYTKWDVAKC